MKEIFKNFLIFLFIFLIIAGFLSLYSSPLGKEIPQVSLDVLMKQIEEEKVEKIEIEQDKLNITLKDGPRERTLKEPGESFSTLFKNYNLNPEKLKKIKLEVKEPTGWNLWLGAALPFLIPFFLIGIFIWFMMRQAKGINTRAMMFGQSRAREIRPEKEKKDKITFADVAGLKEAKEELEEVVEFLKNPGKFSKLGARVPKGVLLVGPPGCGKTLLARAVASEANVPFFHVVGSEFVELFVGVGASRIRSLFNKAKKNLPCLIFIDELDAIGRQRGLGVGGSHEEREQTLNQVLAEMDGFDPHTNCVVLAATNRPDVLDSALLRPGRFDRRIVVEFPDIADREAILKVHAKNKPLASHVDLRNIAERTPGFSGADLANLLNEAAILTARRDKTEIGMDEITSSIEKVLLGPERKSHILNKKEKKITAYHEASHALVAHLLPHPDPVQKISIISRGGAAGYTLKMPQEDKRLHSKAEFIDELAVLLAGWVVEREKFGEMNLTTGATNDLKQATKLSQRLVTEYGMSEKLGPRTYGQKTELIFLGQEISEQRDYSEKVAALIDQEVSLLLIEAAKTAQEIIKKNKVYLEKITKILLEKETIERKEFVTLFS